MFGVEDLVLAWAVYFSIHSIWASSVFKNIVNSRVKWLKSSYRLLFNFFAVILLIPVIYIQRNLKDDILLFEPVTAILVIGYAGIAVGVLIGIAGFKNYDFSEFTGIYQLKHHHDFHPEQLNTSGLHGVVRHPLYFALIVMLWSYFLTQPQLNLLVSGLCITAYLYIGTLFEEKKLIDEFGDIYREYKKNVSMLIPVKWIFKTRSDK